MQLYQQPERPNKLQTGLKSSKSLKWEKAYKFLYKPPGPRQSSRKSSCTLSAWILLPR